MRSILACLIFLLCGLLASCGGSAENNAEGGAVKLRVNVDPVAKALELNREVALEYTERTGVEIEFIVGPMDATDRLSQYLQYLGARSPDIDIYQVDVIWPGILGEHFVDLGPAFEGELESFFEPLVANNRVGDRLVAIPWFADAGLLYYRTDLLQKYGFDAPPQTWDELEAMAAKIQEGERAGGNPDFWGYVWQGRAYEGLTCNALEWQVSHGGGSIVEPDGRVSVNNPQAAAAMQRAASWVDRISPPGVTSYQEEEARLLFQQGNAAFMRNWPYAHALASDAESPIAGKFDITVLPSGGGGHAAALGGWQLAVSKYSRHAEAAAEFVKFMTSPEVQKRRLLEANLLPTRKAVYADPDVAAQVPYADQMKNVFANATPRPSTATGERYNEVSTRYFQAVHEILTGRKEAAPALAELEQTLRNILE